MEYEALRQTVVDAGMRLVESGLIARTWGNVSCRVNGELFAVTPSGRAYDTLSPSDIVLVSIANLQYVGPTKPSSEMKIHAAVYRIRKDVNFIIHTHQMNASVVSALCLVGNQAELSGLQSQDLAGNIPIAAYGLPGSTKLCRGVVAAVEKSQGNAIIMAHHGALCMGKDADEAFKAALELEDTCQGWIRDRCSQHRADGNRVAAVQLYSSERTPSGAALLHYDSEKLTEDVERVKQIHENIYENRRDINWIIHAEDPDILEASARGGTIYPQLDDMAQIIGTSLKTAELDLNNMNKTKADILKALKGRHGVLIKDCGALCCGATKKDAEAVRLIMDKGCRAAKVSQILGTQNRISQVECALMRINYLKNYSKKSTRC